MLLPEMQQNLQQLAVVGSAQLRVVNRKQSRDSVGPGPLLCGTAPGSSASLARLAAGDHHGHSQLETIQVSTGQISTKSMQALDITLHW